MVLLVALAFVLATCTYDDWQNPKNDFRENAISVEEAKAFFEEQMMRMGETGSSGELTGFATNFTPQWDDVVVNGQGQMVSVDVPIIADIQFRAVFPVVEASKTRWVSVDMLQKLIVVKDLQTGNMGSYVVSIIPDKAYAQYKTKMSAMDFPNYGDYGDFSGRIIYSFPLSPLPLLVNSYQDGILTDEASFFDSWNNPEEMKAVGDKMETIMNGVSLKRMFRIALRSGDIELPEVVITGNNGNGGGSWWSNGSWYTWNQGGGSGNNPPYPGNSGGGGGSSNGNSSNGSANESLSAVAHAVSLNSQEINKLNYALEDLLVDCGFQYMNDQIKERGYKFNNIRIDNTIPTGSGGYNPFTGDLLFYSSDEITKEFLSEEFVHLYQTSVYSWGPMQQYASNAPGNIEFEAKLILDILCWMRGIGCGYVGEGKNHGASYEGWISTITHDGTYFPTWGEVVILNTEDGLNYWDFLLDFVQKPGTYHNLPIDFTYPLALGAMDDSFITTCIKNKNK